jgi:pimeloyl-ACP methyl ester carboxylesterase
VAYLDRDGIRIYYQASGPPAGATPLLLTHGFSASSAMWQPNIAALAAARPVITWDLRGHGSSDAPDGLEHYSAEACVADMAALLDACGIARVVAGGLSLGGFLSLEFCLAHPDRVAGLVLCDTGPGYRRDEARQRWNDRAIEIAGRLERDSARGLALAARGMLTQRDARVIDALPAIMIPALVLVGARDKAYLGAAEYMAARLPRAAYAAIPDAGHVCNVDQPDLFSQQVLAFLDRLEGAQGQEVRSLCQGLCLPKSSRTCATWYGGSWRRSRRSARSGG